MKIPDQILKICYAYGIAKSPEEACGIITEKLEVYPMPNIMNKYHKLNPKEYPRTNLDGYMIDPIGLTKLEAKLNQQGDKIEVIYHTHPKGETYFSEMDKEIALLNGPFYPGIHYLVCSIKDEKHNGAILAVFNQTKGDFDIINI